jgi:hypothetical protein
MTKQVPAVRPLGLRESGPISQQQKIPTFATGSWVKLDYPGPKVRGQVTADVTSVATGCARFVGFIDPATGVEYTVPPELLTRTLSPNLEELAFLILNEDLIGTNMNIEETRDLVMRVVRHVEEERDTATIARIKDDASPTRDTDS